MCAKSWNRKQFDTILRPKSIYDSRYVVIYKKTKSQENVIETVTMQCLIKWATNKKVVSRD